jgi:hypothetical protein
VLLREAPVQPPVPAVVKNSRRNLPDTSVKTDSWAVAEKQI